MKSTQQEIIEQLGEAFDRAVEICGREFVAKSLLERFGAGGGEPVAWIDGADLELMRKDGRGCIAWAQKQSNATTPLYTHSSPTDLRAEYERGLDDAARVAADDAHVVDGRGYYDQLGDAKLTAANIRNAIEALKGKQ